MNLIDDITQLGMAARAASRLLAKASATQLNHALGEIADELYVQRAEIFAANAEDLARAKADGLNAAVLERLQIKEKTLDEIIAGVRQVQSLPNPLGQVLKLWQQPNELRFRKVRVPIGVIGIIYESRPNVTIDAAALCLKTGNAVILRGGSEAISSNLILAAILQKGLERAGLPAAAAQLIATTDRAAIPLLCRQDRYIDVMIPRGGHGLIETVVQHARMPVIKHFHGVCQIYVHAQANQDMAEKIILNAKCQRPGVCNAVETLLVDEAIAPVFVPRIVGALQKAQVEVRGDTRTRELGGGKVIPATEEDWTTEYLDLILSVRVVSDFGQAMEHIEKYGSHHSDAIITQDKMASERFFLEVDSATVYWNASTRFTDGGQFGFGAEIGISTDKLHARGPMALEELTSYKYLIEGNGQVRE